MTPNEFRAIGHELIEWVARYRENVADRNVMSSARPGDVRNSLPSSPPASGEPFERIMDDVERVLLPGMTHWAHPSFFAYFPCNTSLSSVLAELVIAGLGAQGMSWQTSPAVTELEQLVMNWLREMVGLPDTFTGCIQDTASTSTFVALVCARERATGRSMDRAGLQGERGPLVVYTSDQAHSSVDKAALLAGFGRENVRAVETDDTHAMLPDALADAIERDIVAGRKPAAIVATVGTTATTAVDPVLPISKIARRFGIYLHVDAAMCGVAMIEPSFRHLWDGVEHADSVVFDPHKWMGTGIDLSALYMRNPQELVSVFGTNPSYLHTAFDSEVVNFRDWGVALGRRFRALKLWFLIREQGVGEIAARIRRDVDNARFLAEAFRKLPNWQVVAPVPFQTVCVRYDPPRGVADLDAFTQDWVRRVNESGKAYLTPTVVKGQRIVRVSVGAETTERRHVEALIGVMRECAEKA